MRNRKKRGELLIGKTKKVREGKEREEVRKRKERGEVREG